MSNSDTFDYQLSQFAAWYLMEGIRQYFECADEVCQCDTLLVELDRLESWELANSGYYTPETIRERFAGLRSAIELRREWLERRESDYYAERARSEWRVIEGGLSGNLSQLGIN